MGGQRQVKPGNVYQTMTTLLNHRIYTHTKVQKPVWYEVLESIPPSEILIRPLPPQHQKPNPRARKASRLFQPQPITYEEDGLRKTFYRDHPWELARPRMVLEMDGKDARRRDWSRGIMQPGMPLSGECVIQRQMWMMDNIQGITREQAYDKARQEFYALRQEEEVERRIAKEEAQMVGAYFGKTLNKVSMDLEDDQYDRWTRWASKQIEAVQAERNAAYTTFGEEENAEDIDAEEGMEADDAGNPPE
ncbi:mitochondrial ribosomal protein S25 [Annulohypoxylon nitens]|nr:mitochondrial ribosomal protein S25 [Annulohypoxylon nitens]